jgi:hypothetical protein
MCCAILLNMLSAIEMLWIVGSRRVEQLYYYDFFQTQSVVPYFFVILQFQVISPQAFASKTSEGGQMNFRKPFSRLTAMDMLMQLQSLSKRTKRKRKWKVMILKTLVPISLRKCMTKSLLHGASGDKSNGQARNRQSETCALYFNIYKFYY